MVTLSSRPRVGSVSLWKHWRMILFVVLVSLMSGFVSLMVQQQEDAVVLAQQPPRQNSSTTATSRGQGPFLITSKESRTATVMAFAMNYDLFTHQKFVGSLRKSGFAGNIILWVEENTKPGVREYLQTHGVTMRGLTFVNCTYVDLSAKDETKNSHEKERLT